MALHRDFPLKPVPIVVVAVLLTSCGFDTSTYIGDGEISVRRTGLNVGYVVNLDEFDLSKSYSNRYRIEGLPNLDERVSFGLSIVSASGLKSALEHATLNLSLVSDDGVTLFDAAGPLHDWNMSKVYDTKVYEFAYRPGTTHGTILTADVIRENPVVYLNLEYRPPPNTEDLLGMYGNAAIKAGGYK